MGTTKSRLNKADFESIPLLLKEAIENQTLDKSLLDVQALAAKGDDAARLALAHAYYYGGHGLEQSFIEAKYWLEAIDEPSHLEGLVSHWLGTIYYKGLVGQPITVGHSSAFAGPLFKGIRRAGLQSLRCRGKATGHFRSRLLRNTIFTSVHETDKELNLATRMYLAFEACVG